MLRSISYLFWGNRLSIDVILSYIKHVFHLPMSFFATRRTGEIVSRFTDANSIIDALASTILSIFLDVSTVVIISLVFIFTKYQSLFHDFIGTSYLYSDYLCLYEAV